MKKVSLDTTGSMLVVPPDIDSAPIAILPILSLIPQLEPFKAAAANVEAQAQRAMIESEEAWQKGSEFLTVCAQQWDQLEDLRKAVKKPIDDYGKFIQSIFLPIQNRFATAKGVVAERMRVFQKAEERKRALAAEAVRKANEEAAQKLAAEAEARGDTAAAEAILDVAVMVPVPVEPLKLGGTNAYGKSTNVVKRWTATVENPMEVLKAILAGQIPISIIDWKQSELNKVASNLKVEKSLLGLKVYQTETLQQR
ncbi:MAG TPA: hypothetical protein VLH80_07580 [Nitrospiraceae bacterium]|nr:hypothetical protein [Nitrospiraceae bacterium]